MHIQNFSWKSQTVWMYQAILYIAVAYLIVFKLKGIFSDSNNIFLWHKSEDINKKRLFPKFQLILILRS